MLALKCFKETCVSEYVCCKIILNTNSSWRFFFTLTSYKKYNTVVPATTGPLGERPPALAGHFCDVPTTLPC